MPHYKVTGFDKLTVGETTVLKGEVIELSEADAAPLASRLTLVDPPTPAQ